MADIELVDVTLRDGNQSIWGAVGLTTEMVEAAAPLIDRVGYRTCELMTSTQMATAVRYQRQDPWERIRTARRLMPNTPLGFLTTGKRFISFDRTPEVLFGLAFELLVRAGISRFWIVDPMHDTEGAARMASMAREAGAEEVIGGICYTQSPVHSDAYFTERAAELDRSGCFDRLYLKDPAGLLTPERVRRLVPMIEDALVDVELAEIHSHCNTGLAPITVLEAADVGITTIHCAVPPLANGTSHPSAPRLVENLRARAHSVDVDLGAIQEESDYFVAEARRKGLAEGVPLEYDESFYRHTIPGGVLTTLARQLAEMGKPELLPAVKEEAVRVREDLGWPIVVTPFAQYIVTQATLNIVAGERYQQVADEIIGLLLGDFGPMPGPVSEELRDRALNSTRARERRERKREEPTLAELRAKFGARISDEELLLRALMPAGQVDAMVSERDRPPTPTTPLRRLLEDLERRPDVKSFAIRTANLSLEVGRGADGGDR